jgi:hypothetical protein
MDASKAELKRYQNKPEDSEFVLSAEQRRDTSDSSGTILTIQFFGNNPLILANGKNEDIRKTTKKGRINKQSLFFKENSILLSEQIKGSALSSTRN